MRPAVIDTNVIVSGVLAGATDSPNRRIVDALLVGSVRFVTSEALLAEYRDVLLRPAIATRHGLTEIEVDEVLAGLVVNAAIRPPSPTEGGDPVPAGDEHVVSLLRAVPEAVLVTGDRLLAQAIRSWCEVMTPAEFAAGLAPGLA